MQQDIQDYHNRLAESDKQICDALHAVIIAALPKATCKVWHAHPVWFINGNPVVGYHKLKDSVRLLFWSGQSFDEPGLTAEGSFKAAQVRYTNVDQINTTDLQRYLQKAATIQWNYKDIVKNRGQLERL